MTSLPPNPDQYRVVLRMRAMFPADLAGYEAHRLRKGGDTSHINKARSHLNKRFIGSENWAAEALEKIKEIRLENFLDEVTALRKRKRKKDAERRLAEGPKDPWRATRHGPLREVILTANRKYFDDEMAKFLGEDREAEFLACAEKWLKSAFEGDIVHARVDRDEQAFHIHAVLLPIQRVEMTRTDKKTGEKKVIAIRHMLQPSKHDIVRDYEHAQDSVGAAFSVVNLQRGERRAAAIRQARAADQPLPKARYHARTTEWRAERELALEARDAELTERGEELEAQSDAIAAREVAIEQREEEIDAIDAAITGIETGALTLDEREETPKLCAAESEAEQLPQAVNLMARLTKSPIGKARAASLLARLFGTLKRRARADAEHAVRRDVTEIGKARDALSEVVARLSGEAAASGKVALKAMTRSLLALRRYDPIDHDEKNLPDHD